MEDTSFQRIVALATHLREAIDTALVEDGTSAATLLELLHEVRDSRKRLADAEAAIEHEALKRCRENREREGALDTGIRWTIKGGTQRKRWDHRGAGKAYLQARFPADAGGLIVGPTDVLDALLEAASIGYWRTTALKGAGIDPDEYCEVDHGRSSVIFG